LTNSSPSSNNTTFQSDSSQILFLIEPSEASGVKTVSLRFWKKVDLAKKSEEAMNNAMNTIQNVAKRVNSTIQRIDAHNKPDNVEVEFGLKFNADLDVVIAKAGVEASIVVTLSWTQKK
jgi:hypothetical protein